MTAPAPTSVRSPIMVRPKRYRSFGSGAREFCLVTDTDLAAAYEIDVDGYDHASAVPIDRTDQLDDVLSSAVPDLADVLVICRRTFLTSPGESAMSGRRMIVMPCASTPVTSEQIRYFLSVLEATDPQAQARRAEAFFAAVESSAESLLLTDAATTCRFNALGGDYVWNQQAGPLDPGEQQIAPPGELSVLPMEITDFDPSAGLALDGSLTLRGQPIVHAGYDDDLVQRQAILYQRLQPLTTTPVIVDIAGGVITACRPGEPGPAGLELARVLDELLTEEPRYRVIWELGFGINTDMRLFSANCGLNEPFGGSDGVVHFGLGLTPFTEFALTFLCPSTVLADESGSRLIGGAPIRKINRTRSASCGCHP